jgi:cell division protein FtsN
MTSSRTASRTKGKLPRAFMALLAFVLVFFIAVLVFVFVATKKANPIMLDQNGKPLPESSQSSGESH